MAEIWHKANISVTGSGPLCGNWHHGEWITVLDDLVTCANCMLVMSEARPVDWYFPKKLYGLDVVVEDVLADVPDVVYKKAD